MTDRVTSVPINKLGVRREDMNKANDRNVEAVREKLKRRADLGLQKYGCTTERTDLSLVAWIAHAQEEAMDFAIYAERIMREILDSGVTAQVADKIEQENPDKIEQENRLIRERNKRLEYEVKKLAERNNFLEAQNVRLRNQLDDIKKAVRGCYGPSENEGSEL